MFCSLCLTPPTQLIAQVFKETTMTLITDNNLQRPDDFYERLIAMHKDLSDAQSESANAQLILLLANHIGDLQVLQQAMDLARTSVQKHQPA
jgi:hypothetical protein